MDETLNRILKTMKAQHVTDYAMEEYLNVPHGTVSNWKREKGKSYYYCIAKIADKLEVPIDYLIRGKYDSEVLSMSEKMLITGFRKLSDEAREVIEKNVRLLLGADDVE